MTLLIEPRPDGHQTTLDQIDAELAGLAARLIEAAMQSAAARNPEQADFLDRLRRGDRLGTMLMITMPGDAPGDALLELALVRDDGEPVARVLGLTARRLQCVQH